MARELVNLSTDKEELQLRVLDLNKVQKSHKAWAFRLSVVALVNCYSSRTWTSAIKPFFRCMERKSKKLKSCG
jgi:hypothetical protein